MFLEASTGIEPVYTDLQSAASPLRQLAPCGVDRRSNLGEGVSSAPGRRTLLRVFGGLSRAV